MEHFAAGLGTGLAHAVLYNPYDRALYLSVKNKTKFLDKQNHRHPFQGLHQSLFHRTVSNGLYFSIQSMMQQRTDNPLYIGLVGGVTIGTTLNPISVIKYNCWGKTDYTFSKSAKDLYTNGGLKIFSKGMISTVTRDVVYCCIYERWRKRNSNRFLDQVYNLGISVTATIFSSPFNYVRNVKYATPSNVKVDNDFKILYMLYKNKNYEDLRLGWGTLRCGLGMVTGQIIYGWMFNKITENSKKSHSLKN
jgi:hypothetical protein